jgi:Zn-dependent M28 family amino/carboxypeptidase
MSDYLNEASLDRVRLDDYNVYMIIQKMQKNKRDAVWPVNFNQQRNIRALRINYSNKAVMMNNAGKDCYAVFKSYYQLCEEERREAGIKTHYSMH